jgi:hypothetical protein
LQRCPDSSAEQFGQYEETFTWTGLGKGAPFSTAGSGVIGRVELIANFLTCSCGPVKIYRWCNRFFSRCRPSRVRLLPALDNSILGSYCLTKLSKSWARYPSGKGEVSKTFMRRFDSGPRLQLRSRIFFILQVDVTFDAQQTLITLYRQLTPAGGCNV